MTASPAPVLSSPAALEVEGNRVERVILEPCLPASRIPLQNASHQALHRPSSGDSIRIPKVTLPTHFLQCAPGV